MERGALTAEAETKVLARLPDLLAELMGSQGFRLRGSTAGLEAIARVLGFKALDQKLEQLVQTRRLPGLRLDR